MSGVTVVQAQPGFVVLHDDGTVLFTGAPIIAWAIEATVKNYELTSVVYPVTPDGSDVMSGILYPNGEVSIRDCLYPSLEAAREDLGRTA